MSQSVTGSDDGQSSPSNGTEHGPPIYTTRGKIVLFLAGLISFSYALYLFIQSETGVVNVVCASIARAAFYCTATTLFIVVLVFILFTNKCNAACEFYRQNFLLKSVGDFLVMSATCFLLKLKNSGVDFVKVLGMFCQRDSMAPAAAPGAPMGAAAPMTPFSPEIADLLVCVLLTVTAFSLINLLSHGYHYSIFEVTTTLTMHLSMELLYSHPYISAATISFVFLIISLKNFLWRNVAAGHA